MSTKTRIFEDMSRMATGAIGAARGVGEEIETIISARIERFMATRNWVTREEFEAVSKMAANSKAEIKKLSDRLAALETGKKQPTKAKAPARKPSAKAARAGKTAAAKSTKTVRKAPSKAKTSGKRTTARAKASTGKRGK